LVARSGSEPRLVHAGGTDRPRLECAVAELGHELGGLERGRRECRGRCVWTFAEMRADDFDRAVEVVLSVP
jgi:hypothetical protein